MNGSPKRTTGLGPRDAQRLDGKIENALSGLGINNLDVYSATARRAQPMSVHEARAEYRGSFAARREIDQPAGDIVAEGFELEGLPQSVDPSAVMAYLAAIGLEGMPPEDRGALQALSRLYGSMLKAGGAVGVMIIEDGLEPWEPVDPARTKDLLAIEVLERDEVTPWSRDGHLARPEFYVLGGLSSPVLAGQIVHRSRVIIGVGDRLSPSEEAANMGWGCSRLEQLSDERMGMHAAWAELPSMMAKGTIDAVYIAELAEMMCETADAPGDSGRTSIEARLALMARSRSQHKIFPMDAGRDANAATGEPGRPSDRLESIARQLRGAQDLAIASGDHWAGGTGQTPSIALGRQAGGLNTGANEGDARSWDGKVSNIQTTWLEPRLRIVLEIVFAASNGPTRGRVPASYSITFPPTFRPTEAEKASTAQAWANVDQIYMINGVLSPDEVREQRLVQGVSGPLTLDPSPAGEEGEGENGAALEGEEELVDEELDALEQAWSDAAPPEDSGTSTELAAHEDLVGKISAHGITRLAAEPAEIETYGDLRRGKRVPVYSLRDVKRALLARGGVELDDGQRSDTKRRWWQWRRRR
jgi:phage-related protein (TIGR01555 family)